MVDFPEATGATGFVNGPSNWEIDASGTRVVQSRNANASILLGDLDVANTSIEGTWSVRDTGAAGGTVDDDFIGFVFGYQDAGHFYLFDWRRAFGAIPTGASANAGMSIKVVSADSPLDSVDLWNEDGSAGRVTTLFRNSVPWENFTDYQFSLDFRPGQFTIIVREGETVLESITISDDTYLDGAFGFYNYSQGLVEYRGFTSEQLSELTYRYDADAVDPDDDSLIYTLLTSPDGMVIGPDDGLVTWAPTAEQIGDHLVEIEADDGRGGTAVQRYIVSVKPEDENHPPIIVSQPSTTVVSEVASDPGRVIFANDEWALADNVSNVPGFEPTSPPNDPAQFAENIAAWFLEGTGRTTGKFHAFSNNVGFTGTGLRDVMEGLGHEWSVSTTAFPFEIENLHQFDAIFVGGFSVDNNVLIEYVNSGGSVYLAAGSGTTGGFDPVREAEAWREFANVFGFDFSEEYHINAIGNVAIQNDHPLFIDVDHLANGNGQTIIRLDSATPASQVLVTEVPPGSGFPSTPQPMYAVYDPSSSPGNSNIYRYDVIAVDPDDDDLVYSLVVAPAGMKIDEASGLITWPAPTVLGRELVINGGGETGDTSGWVFHGDLLGALAVA